MFKRKILSMVLLVGLLFGQPVPRVRAAICDQAQFVSDLTVPDGSTFTPGAAFTKTWRLKNIGTCTWTTSYKVVWAGGDQLSAPAAVNLPVNVAPGQMVDISVKMTSPTASGHFRGLWKISNLSSVQFGIGNSAADPFWVDINIVENRAVIYDFVANAPYAQWKSGAGALPFPVAGGDDRGYAQQISNPHLEDDSVDASPGLMTVPQNKLNGYIQATYPEIDIQKGDQLQTLVNCEFGSTGCYVTFRVDYRLANGTQGTLWSWKEAYDKKFYRKSLSLDSLAGKKVQIIFMVLASGVASGDRAIWGAPRIVRTGGILPPAPPATLTALPPLTPTVTPYAPPPPTLAPSGCDKATFVSDVTVPDGTLFSPKTAFIKTWRLKNSGTCTWTSAYKLAFYNGEQMGAPTSVSMPRNVPPGTTVDLTVNLTSPSFAGEYRSYWILTNASGALFGIGPTASNPFWVEVRVAGNTPANGAYDFVANLCSAQWKSGAGVLLCPGVDGDTKGFASIVTSLPLENGTQSAIPSLLMAPESKYNGYIQGIYPLFTVQPGDRFQGSTGCAFGSSCYATFRLDYMTSTGAVKTFWTWRESNDGKNNSFDLNLSPLAGQNVRFILTILATGSATGDRVTWVGPVLVHAEAPPAPPTVTPTNTPIAVPGTIVFSPLIRSLNMIDPFNGWAFGVGYLLRTYDGGVTWYNVSMPGVASFSGGYFPNANNAWVLSGNALYHTTDGARTWTQNPVPFNGGFIQFINEANGFVLSGLPSGMHKHAVDLYQTTDGGATWVRKYTNNPLDPSAGTSLPFGGNKTGMTWRDTLRGWVSGESPATGSVYLYRTNDGGTTWVQQALPLPAGYGFASITSGTPKFFNANDGVLPVWMTLDVGQRDLFIYVTRDGGNTWTRSSSFSRQGWKADFVSISQGFTWNINGFMQATGNSGASWNQVASNVNFGSDIPIMDFVSATTGWVVQNQINGVTPLYRTTNGGGTWTLLSQNPQALPNLTVDSLRIELQNTSCLAPGDILGVRVWVRNNGQAAAGGFTVTVNDIQQTVNGLGVGETVPVFFPTVTNPVTVMVDTTNAIPEGDETDNLRSEMVPVPTPPLPCPTETPTVPQDFNVFGQNLVNALNTRTFETIRSMMDQSFAFAFWQSQGYLATANEAVQQLPGHLGTTQLTPNASQDLNALMGGLNPYEIVGLSESNSKGLFVSGWGVDGKGEAVLYFTRRLDGSAYWHSVLVAPTKFIPVPDIVSHDAFCGDARIPALIEQLKGSLNQSNGDGLSALVSPVNGLDIRLWAMSTEVTFNKNAARTAFTSTESHSWGGGPSGQPDVGTFKDVIQPKLLEVLNAPNMERYCDDLTKVFPVAVPWAYPDMRYYNLYKPASDELSFDFRTWLIGFEYVNGQPYLSAMTSIVWEP